MKRILLIFIIAAAVIGGILYFAGPSTHTINGFSWNPFSLFGGRASSTSASSSPLGEKLSRTGEVVAEGTQSALDSASDAIEKQGTAIQNNISEGITGIVGNITQGAKERLAGALGIAPDRALELGQFADLSICTTLKNGNVSYAIGNPFSPAQDFSFRLDWGDGANSQGSLRANDAATAASHHYEKSGSYVNTFQIISGNESLTLKRKVCVE